jgi:TRAP-type mannitol/chloroaromatic compound transport system permease small subunit
LQTLLRISHWIDRLNEQIGRWLNWLVLLMLLVGVWNVIGRYGGYALRRNLSSNALIEIQWYFFDLVFLLGAAYTLKHNEHVRVDVFYSRWSPRRQALADLIGTLLFLIPFCLMVIVFSWNAVLASWAIQEGSPDPGGLPHYPIKTMIIVGFVLLLLQGISDAIKKIAFLRGDRSVPPSEEPDGIA